MTTTPAMPERFTKKPVTVEAFQMTEARRMDNRDWPEWLNEAWNKEEGQPGALFRQNMDAPLPDLLCIQTLEGVHLVNWGDWIIRGVKGELYPCKPDIFEMTYDLAALQSQPAEVSDAEIYALWVEHCETTEKTTRQLVCDFARAILALRPRAVPMTDEQRQQAFNKSWATSSDFFAGIEAAEAHHGITAQGAQGEQA